MHEKKTFAHNNYIYIFAGAFSQRLRQSFQTRAL